MSAGRRRREPREGDPRERRWRLSLDPIACEGRGLCVELLPELVSSDDWGFPILPVGAVPAPLLPAARRAVSACPVLALRLVAEP